MSLLAANIKLKVMSGTADNTFQGNSSLNYSRENQLRGITLGPYKTLLKIKIKHDLCIRSKPLCTNFKAFAQGKLKLVQENQFCYYPIKGHNYNHIRNNETARVVVL